MISKLLAFFRDEQDKDPSFILMTRNILFVIIIPTFVSMLLVTGVAGSTTRDPIAFTILLFLLLLEFIALFFVFQGNVLLSKIIVPLGITIALTAIAATINGLRDVSIVAFPVALIIGALLLGRRSIRVMTPLTLLGIGFIAVMDLRTRRTITSVTWDDPIIIMAILIGASGVIQLLINRLNETLSKVRESERIHIEENRELTELRTSLEERVRQRTAELDTANRYNERRARQFTAIAQVARAISNIQDFDTLLPYITQVISNQFNIYHTSIFLLNEDRTFAVLRATNSEGGKAMLKAGHKLEVGQTGIVGLVVATGQPRIALDVGQDAVYFDNPYLPNTHSEIALPLRIGDQIIGALDLQSEQSGAFDLDDIQTLNTLADQVSIAIQNARTLQDARKLLEDSQLAYGQSMREAWEVMKPKSLRRGFLLSNSSLTPLEDPLDSSHIQDAIDQGTSIHVAAEGTLVVPIIMRNNVIGVLNLKSKKQGAWTEDDIDIVRAVADRLSLALETATLLETTQRRADVERVTTEISARISSSTRFESILQTVAQELSRALGGSDVLVQIEPTALELGMTG